MRRLVYATIFAAVLLPLTAAPGRAETTPVTDDATRARDLYLQARATSDSDARVALFRAGLEAAERARTAQPKDPAALLWWVANKGEVALARGKLFALGDVPLIEAALKELLTVAPDYERAAADRGLARLYQLAPPLISVGSRSKAAQHYAAALDRAPDFMGNQALYADFLSDRGEDQRAKDLARAALSADRTGIDAASVAEWEQVARDVLGAD